MSARRHVPMLSGVMAAATGIAFSLTPGEPASAIIAPSSTTIHLYSKALSNAEYGANGQPITDPNAAPVPGDFYTATDIDYPGSNKSHGAMSTGYDHLVCTFTSVASTNAQAVCDAVLFYKGSMLNADHQPLTITFTSPQVVEFPITEGTGQFRGVHGTVTAKDIGNSNNANFTITYSR